MLSVYEKNAFCNDRYLVYSVFHVTFYDLCYVPKRSLHTWGVSQMLKNLLKFSTSHLLHIFRSYNLLYYVKNVWSTNLEIQKPIRRKDSQSHSSFFSTLFTWWRV